MAFYQFSKTQKFIATIDELWAFISDPGNLKLITPPSMGFEVTSGKAEREMYPGMIITYFVRPLFGIKMRWVTEITQVNDKEYFVDEQRLGPYTMWHHQHRLIQTEDGVLMEDTVSYIPPFGFLGAIANSLIIRSKLEEIFAFRTKVLEEKFRKLN